MPEDHSHGATDLYAAPPPPNNRDSGTSSPLSHEKSALPKGAKQPSAAALISTATKSKVMSNFRNSCEHEDESDSNDSVFSSGSSTDSSNACNDAAAAGGSTFAIAHLRNAEMEIRDIYLGGSCMLRTNWRKDFAIPMLNHRGVTYHLPILHESICSMIPECNEPSAAASAPAPAPPSEKVTADRPPAAAAAAAAVEPEVQLRNKNTQKLKLRTTGAGRSDDAAAATDGGGGGGSGGSFSDSGTPPLRRTMFSPNILDASRVLLFTITNETRSLAPMTLAAHYIGLGYNVVLCVQMLPEFCIIGHDKVGVPLFLCQSIFFLHLKFLRS